MASVDEIMKYISGVPYPATKDDVRDYAESQGADDDVMDELDNLPDETYETPGDIEAALGETE